MVAGRDLKENERPDVAPVEIQLLDYNQVWAIEFAAFDGTSGEIDGVSYWLPFPG